MGPDQTRPGACRHPKGDARIELGDITRHQLKLSILGVSLRARTRVAGQSARQGVGGINGRVIDGVIIDKERLVSSVRKKDELVGIINGSRS